MSLKSWLQKTYVKIRTRPVVRELRKMGLSFPLPAGRVKNVLIILPREIERVDAAVTLVHELRQIYPQWNFMVMDIDKLLPHKLNTLQLPNQQFIRELTANAFDLVVDLNSHLDIRIGYLLLMLKIPYRVHLAEKTGEFYNILVQPNSSEYPDFKFVIHYMEQIFTA